MTPYYSDDLVTIYHGDAGSFLHGWYGDLAANGYVVVTDPPYGTGAYASDKDATRFLVGMVDQFDSVAVFGWPEDLAVLCVEIGDAPNEWIVWWPTNAALKSWNGAGGLPRESEHIAIFGAVRQVHGAPLSDGSRRFSQRWNRREGNKARSKNIVSPQGKRWGDVWTDPSPGLGFQSDKRRHPNEKPVELMARLLQVVAERPLLDPFMGSGTTLVAAKSLGRKAVGIEIEERYCEIAANRCRQEVLGLSA